MGDQERGYSGRLGKADVCIPSEYGMLHGGNLDPAAARYGVPVEHRIDLSKGITPLVNPHAGISRENLCRLSARGMFDDTDRASWLWLIVLRSFGELLGMPRDTTEWVRFPAALATVATWWLG